MPRIKSGYNRGQSTWQGVLCRGLLLVLLALSLFGCDSAQDLARAEAIRSEARSRDLATQQALGIQATATALQAQEELAIQPERIKNREMREKWSSITLIVLVASLAALAVGWLVGEVSARITRARHEAATYRPDPETGAMPVVRLDYAPGKVARFVHEAVPLIRLLMPDFKPVPLQYATMIVDLDTGTQLQVRRVLDDNGRLHVWQESRLGPPGQQALAHHTRRVVALGQAVADMKQGHEAAGDIAQAVPLVGSMPAFEPTYRSDNGYGRQVWLDDGRG